MRCDNKKMPSTLFKDPARYFEHLVITGNLLFGLKKQKQLTLRKDIGGGAGT